MAAATASWLAAASVGALVGVGGAVADDGVAHGASVSFEDQPPPPTPAQLLLRAAKPLVKDWVNERTLSKTAERDAPCLSIYVVLDWIARNVEERHDAVRAATLVWQDRLISTAVESSATAGEFFSSDDFRALMSPVLDMQRLYQHSADVAGALAMLHGDRCFFPKLRDALGAGILGLSKVSTATHAIQLAAIFKSMLSFWDESTDVLKHIRPLWEVIEESARVAQTWHVVRLRLDAFSRGVDDAEPTPEVGGFAAWQDDGGAFSDMNYMQRQLMDGWHLDQGLVASLLRLWTPPHGAAKDGACWMTIADFGAGGGHYCEFLNGTGDFCCQAFDGSPNAEHLSGGKVLTLRLDEPFDLGRTFDWVMCLEVAEHIPREREQVLLENIRRHAAKGLVLSWSDDGHEGHPNARDWPEVRSEVEALGFVFDEAASRALRPRIEWLKGAVRIFRRRSPCASPPSSPFAH